MTPDEWLADFEAKTAELQRNAAAFKRNLETAGTTVTSEDKSITATVAANGALLDLKIEGNSELAGKIVALIRSAREQAATNVLNEFKQVAGSHAGQLDTDVSVPPPPAEKPAPAAKPREDDDFSGESYSDESWSNRR